MAERVGPDGTVLAVDLDTTHVEPLEGGVLEVRRHDLRHDELPAGVFDLVHERSVLSWLGDSDALERLVASLAPGGWLLAEDFDWAKVPDHLKITFRIVDERRRKVAEDKDLEALRLRMKPKARQALSQAAAATAERRGGESLERSGLTDWTIGTLTRVFETRRAGQPVKAYPALVDDGDTGFLVPRRDPRIFADRIERILDEPLLAQAMSRRAAQKARSYTWSFAAARLRRVYADLGVRELVACS